MPSSHELGDMRRSTSQRDTGSRNSARISTEGNNNIVYGGNNRFSNNNNIANNNHNVHDEDDEHEEEPDEEASLTSPPTNHKVNKSQQRNSPQQLSHISGNSSSPKNSSGNNNNNNKSTSPTTSQNIQYQQLSTLEDDHTRYRKYKMFFFLTLGLLAVVLAFLFIFGLGSVDIMNNDSFSSSLTNSPVFTILHMNDVYEIAPVAGLGGLARIKTIYDDLQKHKEENGKIIMILAGDFLAPSALGLADVEVYGQPAQPLNGMQMVAVLNLLGVPKDSFLVTFGNHDIGKDIPAESIFRRINESNFTYLSTNVIPTLEYTPNPIASNNEPSWDSYNNVKSFIIKDIDNVKVAFLSFTMPATEILQHATIFNFFDSVNIIKNFIKEWKNNNIEWDILVLITHQELVDDRVLALLIDEVDIIIGGHNHENSFEKRASSDPSHSTVIAKADSNCKTIWLHRFYIDKIKFQLFLDELKKEKESKKKKQQDIKNIKNENLKKIILQQQQQQNNNNNNKEINRFGTASKYTGIFTIQSELLSIGPRILSNINVEKTVEWWKNAGFQAFEKMGLLPSKPMGRLTEPLNFIDNYIRNRASAGGRLMAKSSELATSKEYKININQNNNGNKYYPIDLGFVNIGAVKLDDKLPPNGLLTQYDAIRIIPYGGTIHVVEITGQIFKSFLYRATLQLGTGLWIGYDYDKITCLESPIVPTTDCIWKLKKQINNDNNNNNNNNDDDILWQDIQDDMIYTLSLCNYITQRQWDAYFNSTDDFKHVKELNTSSHHAVIQYFEQTYPV